MGSCGISSFRGEPPSAEPRGDRNVKAVHENLDGPFEIEEDIALYGTVTGGGSFGVISMKNEWRETAVFSKRQQGDNI